MPLWANNNATVLFLLSYISGLWFHYDGGIILLSAKCIATVHPYLFYVSGIWFQHCGGTILFIAKYIATVDPLVYSTILGSWYHY